MNAPRTTTVLDRIWFSTDQAADYTGHHPQTVRKALQSGELVGSQRCENGRWRIHRDQLDAWMSGAP